MNFRKKATLKAMRISKGVSGYYIVKHSWIWKINQYWPQMIETRDLVKLLILRGFRFTTEELATIFSAARHGNPYQFPMFESGEYVPSARDIEKVLGLLKFQEKADLSEKMRMFRDGRKIANTEMVRLEGIGLEK